MYGLSPDDDQALGQWMQSRLRLAVWKYVLDVDLLLLESQVKKLWSPPLNLDVDTPWRRQGCLSGPTSRLNCVAARRSSVTARDYFLIAATAGGGLPLTLGWAPWQDLSAARRRSRTDLGGPRGQGPKVRLLATVKF